MKNILYTRLIRPKSKNVLHRNENLQYKLDLIEDNKLTVVKGGAAVGKSTLISNYIGEKDNYMWLSLDDNSDDLSYFWTYILHGVKNKIEDLNFYIDMINPLVKREDIFELIDSLINELIGEDELFIVLDDFHYIEDKFLMETIEYFINNSSDNIHFVLISRYDIKLYLGNILMKSGVININPEDFNLTLDETKEFISKTTNMCLDEEILKEIYLNTEGWIGAVKLLLTILSSKKSMKCIPKGNKLFIDYMNNEIISSLSQEEIEFLVKTSPLNYVNPDIYKEIDNKDGFKIIEGLIEKNMLIIMIDEEKRIFRYHNILRQHLIELFDMYDEKDKNYTITKITKSLIDDGNYDEAVSIFLNYKRYEDAIKVIEKNGHNIVSMKILNDFPLEYYSKSVDLAITTIFFNYLNLDYERCSVLCDSFGDDANKDLVNCSKILKIIVNNYASGECYFELPKEIDNNYNILSKTIYYIIASWILGFWGECTKALEMVDLIEESNRELKNRYVDLVCKYNKVSLLEEMGKLRESLNGYRELTEAIDNKKYKSCFSIFKNVGLPGVYIKKLMDKEAEELLNEAKKILNEYRGRAVSNGLKYGIDYNLAEVKYIQGDISECERLLSNIDKENKEGYVYIQMLALKIRLLASEGKIKKEEYEDFIRIYEKIYLNLNYSINIKITYGEVLFELGRYEEGLDAMNKVASISRKNGVGYSLIYSLIWKAIILSKFKPNDEREIANVLKEAIFYSRDEDVLFPYYKTRKYLKEILKKFIGELLKDKDNKEFIKKLCEIMGIKEENEVLSSREIEVLQALVDGLTNKEIGEKLFISVSTVKTHIINIYSKLGVKNRVEAVNEGRKVISG
jgi:ATP-dependent transcriptional regulator